MLEHDDLHASSRRRTTGGADAVAAERPSNYSTSIVILGECRRLDALDAGMWMHAYYLGRRTAAAVRPVVLSATLIDMHVDGTGKSCAST